MEKKSAVKNMSISLILESICFQGGKIDITDKKQPPVEITLNNFIIEVVWYEIEKKVSILIKCDEKT